MRSYWNLTENLDKIILRFETVFVVAKVPQIGAVIVLNGKGFNFPGAENGVLGRVLACYWHMTRRNPRLNMVRDRG